MRLAGARVAQRDDVLPAEDVAAAGQLQNEDLVEARDRGEVVGIRAQWPQFAAWLGLTPRQISRRGQPRRRRTPRKGDRDLRRLLIIGARMVLLRSKASKASPWIQGLLARCARWRVAVSLPNKTARTARAMMLRGESYRPITAA